MKALLLALGGFVLDALRGWLGAKKASAEDLGRALDYERKADEADKRAGAGGDLDERLRELDGLR